LIFKIPVWHANVFVALVAAYYLMFVAAMQIANERIVEIRSERLLFPMWTRLAIIAWLFGTAVLGISQQKWLQDQPSLYWGVLGFALVCAFLLSISKPLYQLTDEIPLHWILAAQTLRAAIPFLIPLDPVDFSTNPDLIIGISAPAVALFYYIFGYRVRWTLITWSIAAIILSLLRLGSMERMTLYFPFIWLPLFITPLTLVFHVIALRKSWLKESP
jgi:hypothetical protein